MRNLGMVLIFWLALVLGCVAPSSNRTPVASNTSTTGTPATEGEPRTKQNPWSYSDYADEMGRGRIFRASTQSTNTLSFDFPYQGEQHCTLTLREHPQQGKDIYLTIEKGQLLDSDYHGKATVRFDNDKAITFNSANPADGSSETLFLRGAFPAFLSRLKTAKILKVEFPVYHAGNQVCVFDVEGFTWKKQ